MRCTESTPFFLIYTAYGQLIYKDVRWRNHGGKIRGVIFADITITTRQTLSLSPFHIAFRKRAG